MPKEKSTEKTPRRFLDQDTERFGFMGRGRACDCLSCTIRIEKDSPRFWDNKNSEGPLCTTCAKRILILGKPDSNVVDPAKFAALDKRTKDMMDGLLHISKQIDKLTASVKQIAALSIPPKLDTFDARPPACDNDYPLTLEGMEAWKAERAARDRTDPSGFDIEKLRPPVDV